MALELSGCDLGSDQINLLAKYIKKNKSISMLDISGNKMDDIDAAKSLALAVKKYPELCFLNLSDCDLGASTTATVLVRLKHVIMEKMMRYYLHCLVGVRN